MNKGMCTNKKLGQLLADYSLGFLTEQQEIAFETHLLECDVCHQQLAEALRLNAVITAHPQILSLSPPSRRSTGRIVSLFRWHSRAILTTALLLLCLTPPAVLVYLGSLQTDRFGFSLPVIEQMKSQSQADSRFQAGITAYQTGHYAAALDNLTAYLQKHPRNFDSNFFGGLAALRLCRHEILGFTYHIERPLALTGITYLSRARDTGRQIRRKTGNYRYLADALYFLGRAQYMLGENEKCRRSLKEYLALKDPSLPNWKEVEQLYASL